MAAPLVSIVIPSRNNRERLARTLASACCLEFDLAALEVVVEDDGSTDGTYEAFAGKQFPFRFVIERGEHRNQSAATNAAIGRSSGKYVLSSAADLVFDSQLVAKRLAMHRRFAGDPVGVLGHLPYLAELNERPFHFYLMHGGPQFAYSSIRDPYRIPPNFCYAPNFSLEREVFDRVGGFDPFFRYGGQDTDLGYRLALAGVRLVYEAQAIAWHDHPVTLTDYFRRQEAAGISSVLLELRYPDLEGGGPLWDAVLSRYLCYPLAMMNRDQRLVELLEPLVASAHPHYQELWAELYERRSRRPESLGSAERCVFEAAETLFSAYDRQLRFHWGKSFTEEAIRRHGAAHVASKIHERFTKWQTTVQFRRVAETRAAAHGIELELCGEADALDTLVIYDVPTYSDALTALIPFCSPHDGVFSRQVLLVVEQGRLGEIAEVVPCRSLEEGLVRAFGQSRGEFVAVRSAQVRADDDEARWIFQKLFERLAVIGGALEKAGSTRSLIGYRFDGSAVMAGPHGARSAPQEVQPVDVAIPDCLVLRGATARALARDGASLTGATDRRWTEALARIVTRSGGLTCYVPALRCSPLEGSADCEPRLEPAAARS